MRVAVQDTFGESGKPDELLEKYGLSTAHIIAAVPKSHRKSMIYLGVGSNEGNRWEALAYGISGSFIGWGAGGGLISYL
jgi:hypothetical protein